MQIHLLQQQQQKSSKDFKKRTVALHTLLETTDVMC